MAGKPNPIDISDEDIEKMYREMWGFSHGNYQTKMAADLLTAEMNRRLVAETSELNTRLTEETARESSNWAKLSLGISVLALSIACLSGWFSYMDYKGDFEWQSAQIKELQKLDARLTENSKANELALVTLGKGLTSAIKSVEASISQSISTADVSNNVETHNNQLNTDSGADAPPPVN